MRFHEIKQAARARVYNDRNKQPRLEEFWYYRVYQRDWEQVKNGWGNYTEIRFRKDDESLIKMVQKWIDCEKQDDPKLHIYDYNGGINYDAKDTASQVITMTKEMIDKYFDAKAEGKEYKILRDNWSTNN